ncbi:MAG TPA: hypothetical protein VH482_21145 [Thermomicrobiales bacterium]|jgi:hypothetical protein
MDGGDTDRRDRPAKSATLGRELVWAALAIAFAVYLGTGRVSTYLGAEGRGRSAVWDVWQNLFSDLPGGDSFVLRLGYALMIVVFVGGSLVALWLALAADGSDEPRERPVADLP